MQFKAIFFGACAAALVSAQSSVLFFTRVPNPITVGQATALTYMANDTESPVSIILRKGTPSNLQVIATLTDNATGGQYIWTPSRELTADDDYALELTQGSSTNYFGPFSIQGGSSPTPSGYGSSSSSSSTASPTGYYPITSSISAYPTYSANSTTYYPGTGTGIGSSCGTASTISRNTTFSSATLSTSYKPTTAVTTTSDSSSTTSGAGFQSPSARPTNAASGLKAGSSIALVFGAIAAVLYA